MKEMKESKGQPMSGPRGGKTNERRSASQSHHRVKPAEIPGRSEGNKGIRGVAGSLSNVKLKTHNAQDLSLESKKGDH